MTTELVAAPSLLERLHTIAETERANEQARRDARYADLLKQATERLTRFVRDVLDLDLDPSSVRDVSRTAEYAYGEVYVSAEVDGITLEADPDHVDVVLLCDRCGRRQPLASFAGYIQSLHDLADAVYAFERHREQCPGVVESAPVGDPVEQAIARVEALGAAWGDAESYEQQLADDRALEKQAAILRIMQTTNPLTQKAHSASSADAVVEQDQEYRAYRQRQSEAVVKKFTARGQFEAAKLRAERLVQREKAAR